MSIRYVALSLSMAAVTAAATSAHAQTKVPGWTYAYNITFDSGTGSANRGSMAMRFQTTATAMRMEIVQIAGTANRNAMGIDISGMYTIMNDADSTYTSVMPSQQMAMVMQNPTTMLANQPKASFDVKSKTTSVEDLGPGDKILGHATHHYRMKTVGTMTVTRGDDACTRSMDGETEVWVAPDVDMSSMTRSMAAHSGAALPDMSGVEDATPIKGVPLRSKTRQTAVMPNGESRVVETTNEFVELSNAPLDPSLFKVPADYHLMDMRKEMAKLMANGGDSLIGKATAHLPICGH
ncbi:MAG TPA: DUF4412 domain-containing protein [Gemmatimonadaceae bacterium]